MRVEVVRLRTGNPCWFVGIEVTLMGLRLPELRNVSQLFSVGLLTQLHVPSEGRLANRRGSGHRCTQPSHSLRIFGVPLLQRGYIVLVDLLLPQVVLDLELGDFQVLDDLALPGLQVLLGLLELVLQILDGLLLIRVGLDQVLVFLVAGPQLMCQRRYLVPKVDLFVPVLYELVHDGLEPASLISER